MHKQWIPGFPFLCPPKNLGMRLVRRQPRHYPLVHAAWPGPSGHEALTWPPVLEWLTLGLTWLFRTWVWPDLLLCLLWWLEPDLPCCIKNGSPNNGWPPPPQTNISEYLDLQNWFFRKWSQYMDPLWKDWTLWNLFFRGHLKNMDSFDTLWLEK